MAAITGRAPASLVIEAGTRWSMFQIREAWEHRELLYLLAGRDIKVRYKQTVLGVSWAILQPLTTMVVFSILFGNLAHIPSDGVPYPIFAYVGLLPWTFFSNAVTASSNSLVGNANLISKVYFPRIVIPAAGVLAGMLDFAISSAILFAMMAFYGIWPRGGFLMFLPLVLLTVIAAFGVGLWISALNVKYRDVRYIVPFAMQLWLYLTPIIYPVSIIPVRWRPLLAFNPLAGTLSGYRSALLGKPFDWNSLALSAGATLLIAACGLWSFARMEREFADII